MGFAETMAIDPSTANEVIRTLEEIGPYEVKPLAHGEIHWHVEGCVFDLDGWLSTVWNAGSRTLVQTESV